MRNVLILGSGRSGTSMLGGTFSHAGWFVGDAPYAGREANPKGFYESAEINGINEDLLAAVTPASEALGAWQRWLARLPVEAQVARTTRSDDRIRRAVARAPFAYKDPRFSWTLPAWTPFVGDALRVCVFRHPAATAASIVKECGDAEYLRSVAMHRDRALAIWAAQYGNILRELSRTGEWMFLHFEQVLTSAGLDRIERAVGAPVSREFPDAALRRSLAGDELQGDLADLYAELCERAQFRIADATPCTSSRIAAPETTPAISILVDGRHCTSPAWDEWEMQTAAADTFEVLWAVEPGANFSERAGRRTVEVRGGRPLADAFATLAREAAAPRVILLDGSLVPDAEFVQRHLEHARSESGVFGSVAHDEASALGLTLTELERREPIPRSTLEHAAFPRDWVESGFLADIDESWPTAGHALTCMEDAHLVARRRDPIEVRDWLEEERRRAADAVCAGVSGIVEFDAPLLRFAQGLTRATADAFVVERLPMLADMERDLAQLGALDVRVVRNSGAPQALLARMVRIASDLRDVAHREGFLRALDELGADSCAELVAQRPWPLATEAPRRVLAWPDWSADELESLLFTVQRELEDVGERVCLCLRHDGAHDGPLEDALARLNAVGASMCAPEIQLEVLVVDEPLSRADRTRLGRAVDLWIDLPSSAQSERTGFRADLGAVESRPALLRARTKAG